MKSTKLLYEAGLGENDCEVGSWMGEGGGRGATARHGIFYNTPPPPTLPPRFRNLNDEINQLLN